MSVIAYDGHMIAADRQATNAGLRYMTTKLRRLKSGVVLAWTGDQDTGELLAQWYEQGANPTEWPEVQKDKEAWCRLIVATGKECRFYERHPVSIKVEDAFLAWGSGRDYAMGAMAMGASARKAVHVASRFDHNCGLGCDVFVLNRR